MPLRNIYSAVNNESTRKRCEICSKLPIKDTETTFHVGVCFATLLKSHFGMGRGSGVFINNFEQIS